MAQVLFQSTFYVPKDKQYDQHVRQINTQELASKMSTLPIANQNQLFILILEYCNQQDGNQYQKIMESSKKKKLYLPYGLTTMKENIHVQGSLNNVPVNLLLMFDNYCNNVLEKK